MVVLGALHKKTNTPRSAATMTTCRNRVTQATTTLEPPPIWRGGERAWIFQGFGGKEGGGEEYYKAQDKYLSKLDGVEQGRASEAENDSGSSVDT